MAGHREVAVDHDAATLRQLDAEHLGERVGAHAGRPHDDASGEHAAVGEVDEMAVAPVLGGGDDPVDADAEPYLDTVACQRPSGALAALRAHRGEQPGRGLDEDHADGANVERREVLRQDLREQLHHRPGHVSTPVGPPPQSTTFSSPRSIIAGSAAARSNRSRTRWRSSSASSSVLSATACSSTPSTP